MAGCLSVTAICCDWLLFWWPRRLADALDGDVSEAPEAQLRSINHVPQLHLIFHPSFQKPNIQKFNFHTKLIVFLSQSCHHSIVECPVPNPGHARNCRIAKPPFLQAPLHHH